MDTGKLPFIEEYLGGDVYIRVFDENESEFEWHRDAEDRIVELIDTTDWLFQFDDALPFMIDDIIFIPKETYHRIIKGDLGLKLRITKIK